MHGPFYNYEKYNVYNEHTVEGKQIVDLAFVPRNLIIDNNNNKSIIIIEVKKLECQGKPNKKLID